MGIAREMPGPGVDGNDIRRRTPSDLQPLGIRRLGERTGLMESSMACVSVGDFECLGIALWTRQSPHSLSAAARVFEFMLMLSSCARGAHHFSGQPERSGPSKAISLVSRVSQTITVLRAQKAN